MNSTLDISELSHYYFRIVFLFTSEICCNNLIYQFEYSQQNFLTFAMNFEDYLQFRHLIHEMSREPLMS